MSIDPLTNDKDHDKTVIELVKPTEETEETEEMEIDDNMKSAIPRDIMIRFPNSKVEIHSQYDVCLYDIVWRATKREKTMDDLPSFFELVVDTNEASTEDELLTCTIRYAQKENKYEILSCRMYLHKNEAFDYEKTKNEKQKAKNRLVAGSSGNEQKKDGTFGA